jgi:hypothetical protein
LARLLLIDQGNPFIAVPKRCQFLADGKQFTQTLTWKPITEQGSAWRARSYNGDTLKVGMHEQRPKVYWVAMPTFQPDAEQRDSYQALFEDIASHRQRYLDADAIVVDLRDNQGGSSSWSEQFAEVLWGKDRVARRMAAYEAGIETWWRASKGNADHFLAYADQMAATKQMETSAWARRNGEGMQQALARKELYFIVRDDAPAASTLDPNADLPTDPPAFSKPLYVVVPGQCASACLDALDVFTRFPNTKLIGAPSSADSTYMDVRFKRLASGMASVIIPNKMYVNRPRANGQGYAPAITVNDLEWSTGNFMKAIEADLLPAK